MRPLCRRTALQGAIGLVPAAGSGFFLRLDGYLPPFPPTLVNIKAVCSLFWLDSCLLKKTTTPTTQLLQAERLFSQNTRQRLRLPSPMNTFITPISPPPPSCWFSLGFPHLSSLKVTLCFLLPPLQNRFPHSFRDSKSF